MAIFQAEINDESYVDFCEGMIKRLGNKGDVVYTDLADLEAQATDAFTKWATGMTESEIKAKKVKEFVKTITPSGVTIKVKKGGL